MEGSQEGGGSADKLIETLREFVQEQSGKPPEVNNGESPPGWRDIAWFAVLIADAVVIYSLIPENAHGPIEFLGKFVPWLVGGLWAVANAWSRQKLLDYSRLQWVRGIELAFLILMGPYWLKLVPFTPRVYPEHTPIIIDDGQAANDERTWLTLRSHTITLNPGPGDPPLPAPPIARSIEMGRLGLLGTVFGHGETELRQVYVVWIRAPQACTIRVTISDPNAEFDDSFLEPAKLQKYEGSVVLRRLPRAEKDYKRALEFDHKGEKVTDTIWLPLGDYKIARSGCAPDPEGLAVRQAHFTKTLETCTPGGDR